MKYIYHCSTITGTFRQLLWRQLDNPHNWSSNPTPNSHSKTQQSEKCVFFPILIHSNRRQAIISTNDDVLLAYMCITWLK